MCKAGALTSIFTARQGTCMTKRQLRDNLGVCLPEDGMELIATCPEGPESLPTVKRLLFTLRSTRKGSPSMFL